MEFRPQKSELNERISDLIFPSHGAQYNIAYNIIILLFNFV